MARYRKWRIAQKICDVNLRPTGLPLHGEPIWARYDPPRKLSASARNPTGLAGLKLARMKMPYA